MLVTDVAIELGIPYIAVLPCGLEKYKKSFSDKKALSKLDEYIKKSLDTIIVDDIELIINLVKQWMIIDICKLAFI